MQGNYKNFVEVVGLWKDTFEYRENILKDPQKEIRCILYQWKVLDLPMSHILVRISIYTWYNY